MRESGMSVEAPPVDPFSIEIDTALWLEFTESQKKADDAREAARTLSSLKARQQELEATCESLATPEDELSKATVALLEIRAKIDQAEILQASREAAAKRSELEANRAARALRNDIQANLREAWQELEIRGDELIDKIIEPLPTLTGEAYLRGTMARAQTRNGMLYKMRGVGAVAQVINDLELIKPESVATRSNFRAFVEGLPQRLDKAREAFQTLP